MSLDLYIQKNCEACEEQLKLLSTCPKNITKEVALLFIGSEGDFKKFRLKKASLILQLQSIEVISQSKSANNSIKGTPTWIFKEKAIKGLKKCSELLSLINLNKV